MAARTRPLRPGRLNEPRPALVKANADGSPREVNRQPVDLVREEWRVSDRWWTEEPIDRHYFEVVLESGARAVVFLRPAHALLVLAERVAGAHV